jgi:capsule polysaccharide export protein KpsE/RkpR
MTDAKSDETEKEFNKRMADLHSKIVAAQKRLEATNQYHNDHKATVDDLITRYNYLQKQLAEEVSDIEAHDHHVSALEKSVLHWINSLQFDHY